MEGGEQTFSWMQYTHEQCHKTAITTCMKAGREEPRSNQRQRAGFLTSACRFHATAAASLPHNSHKACQPARSKAFLTAPQTAPSIARSRRARREAPRPRFRVEAQEGRGRRVPVERLASGAVIADARCNLSISSLFTSLFSFFLNYLKCYLSNNEIWKEKKNRTCRFFALWLMSSFLRRNVLCVLSLSLSVP